MYVILEVKNLIAYENSNSDATLQAYQEFTNQVMCPINFW